MDIKTIRELIKLVGETNLSEVRIEDGEFKITIRTQAYSEGKGPAPVYAAPAALPVAPPVVAAAPVVAPPAATTTPPAAPAAQPSAGGNLREIKSPMVGTFYRSPAPGKPSFIQVGDTIEKGSPVCIIEAMKLFNEIESEFSGRIVKVLAEDSTPVEYEQPLFLIEVSE